MPPTFRFARVSERVALETLQLRASLVWKQYRAPLLAHPDAISIPVEQLRLRQVRVAVIGKRVVGFAAVVPVDAGATTVELDGLFVEPRRMYGGIGRALVADSVRLARRRGARTMIVTAGPAVGFYEKVGFVVVRRARTRFGPAVRMRMALV